MPFAGIADMTNATPLISFSSKPVTSGGSLNRLTVELVTINALSDPSPAGARLLLLSWS